MKYIVALDQGTTSCRAILFDDKTQLLDICQKEFTQFFPKSGWVEHDADEIWNTQLEVFTQLIQKNNINPKDILGIGITNQRETTVLWDCVTGKPVYKAIVWQDKRTADFCKSLREKGLESKIRQKTGLVIDSYFSASKAHWILENCREAKDLAQQEKLKMGTIDSWLIWKMTHGKVHATDYTNASRSLLFNINSMAWDDELLDLFSVHSTMLPKVHPSAYHFGDFEFKGVKIPILGVAGDQQAALFGQSCINIGDTKNTYGTGCFLLMNIGNKHKLSSHGLLTTLACSENAQPIYVLEGSIFVAGAAVQWLRDGLKIIDDAMDTNYFSEKIDSHDILVVPAFAGLGAPYWDEKARGAIFGLTRDTGKNHIIKATLESIAYQTKDVVDAMQKETGIVLQSLMVDGGASNNDFLMQFQADILGMPVDRPQITESTALGVALLVGLQKKLWTLQQIKEVRKTQKIFNPSMDEAKKSMLYKQWLKGVERVKNWKE